MRVAASSTHDAQRMTISVSTCLRSSGAVRDRMAAFSEPGETPRRRGSSFEPLSRSTWSSMPMLVLAILDLTADFPRIDDRHDHRVARAAIGNDGLPRRGAGGDHHHFPDARADRVDGDHRGRGGVLAVEIDRTHDQELQPFELLVFASGDERADDACQLHIRYPFSTSGSAGRRIETALAIGLSPTGPTDGRSRAKFIEVSPPINVRRLAWSPGL